MFHRSEFIASFCPLGKIPTYPNSDKVRRSAQCCRPVAFATLANLIAPIPDELPEVLTKLDIHRLDHQHEIDILGCPEIQPRFFHRQVAATPPISTYRSV